MITNPEDLYSKEVMRIWARAVIEILEQERLQDMQREAAKPSPVEQPTKRRPKQKRKTSP